MKKKRVRSSKKQSNYASPKAMLILKLLGAGNLARDVAKTVPCAKSTVSYWKDHFQAIGALRIEREGVYKTYSLTNYGSKILTGSEEVREVVKLEDHAVKFEIIEHERVPIKWSKLGEPRNWVKLGVKTGNVRVVKTTRNIIIHPGQLRGFDVDELLVESGGIVERVKQILENYFGMMLSSRGIPLHKPRYHFYSKEAEELVEKFGTSTVEGVGAIDASPPEKVPHEEYFGKKLASERLLAPLRLKQMEEKVGGISERQDRLEKHVSAQGEALGEIRKGQIELLDKLPKKMEKIADSFERSMEKHLQVINESQKLIEEFRHESEDRSEGLSKLLNSLGEIFTKGFESIKEDNAVTNRLLVTVASKLPRRRKRSPSKPKKKESRVQRFRKRFRI